MEGGSRRVTSPSVRLMLSTLTATGDKWKGGGRERKHRNEESNWEAIAAVWERAVWEKAVSGSGAGQVWKFWTYFEGRVERICRLSG